MTAFAVPASYSPRWFDATTDGWHPDDLINGGTQTLAAPGGGDWVLLLQATDVLN